LKLLFDQNLAPRLAVTLSDLFPDSAHVRALGMAEADDLGIWVHAKESGFAIISKDNDFQQMSFVFGAPPKIIWLRLGNCTVIEVEDAIRKNASRILDFDEDQESSYLVL
jgi:predicted nuclease of predicted toxin-antitoxin system